MDYGSFRITSIFRRRREKMITRREHKWFRKSSKSIWKTSLSTLVSKSSTYSSTSSVPRRCQINKSQDLLCPSSTLGITTPLTTGLKKSRSTKMTLNQRRSLMINSKARGVRIARVQKAHSNTKFAQLAKQGSTAAQTARSLTGKEATTLSVKSLSQKPKSKASELNCFN